MSEGPFVDLHGISRWYGKNRALNDVTVSLPPGRIGLLGPNGAGKSTLLKILLGLLSPSSGTGTVLGQPLLASEVGPRRHWGQWLPSMARELLGAGNILRRAIGYMSEADSLIPGMKGAEYVALAGELYGMPKRQAQRRAHEVLTYLGLEDARYRPLEQYSMGMKQRLKLAQAIVHDPPVLILDEPTSGMDPSGRDNMLDLLLRLATDHGKTILLCTHLLGDVERVCETVVILFGGEVLRHGKVSDLCQSRANQYRLTLHGDINAFLNEMNSEGVEVLSNDGRGHVRLRVPHGWTTRAFFALADNHNAQIRGLKDDDETLDELFHRVIAEKQES